MNNIVSGILGNTLRRYLVIALAISLVVTGSMFAYASRLLPLILPSQALRLVSLMSPQI